METKILTIIVTLIIACGGWVVLIIQTILGYKERTKNHKDEILLKATDYFTGGTQKRSVGISLIKGMIKSDENYYEVIIPLLSNQFTHLLLQTQTKSPIHEERNLVQIFFLLKEMINSNRSKFHTESCEVLDAILRRLNNDEKSTLNIPKQTLELWQKGLELL